MTPIATDFGPQLSDGNYPPAVRRNVNISDILSILMEWVVVICMYVCAFDMLMKECLGSGGMWIRLPLALGRNIPDSLKNPNLGIQEYPRKGCSGTGHAEYIRLHTLYQLFGSVATRYRVHM